MPRRKKANVVKKPRKRRVKQIAFDRMGLEYKKFVDIPEELIPTEEHVGKGIEVAGQKKRDYYKLYAVKEDSYTTIDPRGQFRSFIKDSVILHRDINLRENPPRVMEIMKQAASKTVRKNSMKKRKKRR